MVRGNLGGKTFNPAPVNLATLCQVSIDEINATSGDQHRLRFISHACTDRTLMIDEVLISRILLNLLSNAIKYSPEGGNIRLELSCEDDQVRLQVSDQGMGISDADLQNIFKPFYRAREVQHISGSGLGLSIVKDCVERHQGRMAIESSPGRGSTFTVILPLVETATSQVS
jgi:signal transduction histidine kinase